jgi:hypothetical protein
MVWPLAYSWELNAARCWRELWTVLATERKHQFDDDTDRDGVLVHSSVNGGEAWVPREQLGRCWWGDELTRAWPDWCLEAELMAAAVGHVDDVGL